MSDNNRINTKTLKEKLPSLNKDCVLIDVRSQDEHLSGSIPGAICIPHDKISECTAQIPKDKEVLLYCRSGGRSSKAKESLKNLGYKNVKDLEGGITAWAESGSPMHKTQSSCSL